VLPIPAHQRGACRPSPTCWTPTPPLELVEEIEAALGPGNRVLDIRIKHEGGMMLQMNLGGSLHKHPDMSQQILAITPEHLGEKAAVRITYRHELDRQLDMRRGEPSFYVK
jgi:hypothetical protein